jgi:hypothetical protein
MFTGFLPAVSKDALTRMSKEVRSWRIHLRTAMELQDLADWINPIVRGSPGVPSLSHDIAPEASAGSFATHLVGVVLVVGAAQKPGQRGPATCTTTSRSDGGWMTTPLPARSVKTPALHWS